MIGLGDLPGGNFSSKAYGVSGDGTIIVGQGAIDSSLYKGRRAFIWDATHEMRDLQDVLIDQYGLGDELEGWYLRNAQDISYDGRVIAGWGYNPAGEVESWRAVIPEPSTAAPAAMGCLTLLVFGCRHRRLPQKPRVHHGGTEDTR